jgi:hypothetical protein
MRLRPRLRNRNIDRKGEVALNQELVRKSTAVSGDSPSRRVYCRLTRPTRSEFPPQRGVARARSRGLPAPCSAPRRRPRVRTPCGRRLARSASAGRSSQGKRQSQQLWVSGRLGAAAYTRRPVGPGAAHSAGHDTVDVDRRLIVLRPVSAILASRVRPVKIAAT